MIVMEKTIQSIIYVFIVPAVYILILYFNFDLVKNAKGQKQRVRMLFSFIGSVILFIMFVLIDQVYQPLHQSDLPSPSNIEEISLYLAIPFLVSAIIMFLTRLLMKPNQALSFVVLSSALGVFISVYYIFRLTQIYVVVIESSFSYYLGFLLDFMLSKKHIFEFNE